jgi:uncharacterized protein (DUF1778 family)
MVRSMATMVDLNPEHIDVHLTQDDSLSEFFKERMRPEHLLSEGPCLVLSDDAWDAFVAELERPAKISPALVELFSRPHPE